MTTDTKVKAFKTFTSSPQRPRIAGAVETILSRIADGESTTAIVKPPRTGKSNVIRLAAIEGLATNLIAGAVVLAPWIALRKQIVAPSKITDMVKHFKVQGNITVTPWEAGTVTPDFLRSTKCHLHAFTIAAACRPTCRTILIDAARYCREVMGKPLVVFIDEGHTVAGTTGWGELAIELADAGAHIVLLTGTPERSDNLAPFGFRTVEKVIATNVNYTTFGPRVGNERMIQERRADRIAFRLEPDFEMTLKEAWDADILCRLRVRWVTCLVNGIDLPDVEDEDLRSIVEDTGIIDSAIDVLLDEIALRRNDKSRVSTSAMVYMGSDTHDAETKDFHASAVLSLLRAKWEARFKKKGLIELATVNQNDEGNKSIHIIDRFTDGASDVLIVKQMGGVGLDVERCKVILDLSTIRTPGNTTQRWLRGATIWGDINHSTLILPETRKTRSLYKRIVEDQGGDITKLINSEIIAEYPADEPGDDDDDLLISEAGASGTSEMSEEFTQTSSDIILRVIRAYPLLGKLSFSDIRELVNTGGVNFPDEEAVEDEDAPDANDPEPVIVNVATEAEKLRMKINKAAKDLTDKAHTYDRKNKDPWVNARKQWINQAKQSASIPLDTKLQKCSDLYRLQKALDFLEARL